MNDFQNKLDSIDKNKIKDFLLSLKKPCYESELLRLAFNCKDISGTSSLELYQNHFVLFYFLYKLQEEFYRENKYLHVHFMRTFVIDYPVIGKCRFYNENQGSFCMTDCETKNSYCDFHLKQIENEIDNLSIKYFYLDENNFSNLNKETAEQFINGSWEVLTNYNEYKKSFEILKLPESADISLIKKQFKILAKKYHPDHGEENHYKFNEINRAYRFLMKIIPQFNNK
jgi:hypothetical protein